MKWLLALMLLTWMPAWAAIPAVSSSNAPSQQERNKAVARRVFDEIFNQGKFQVADEIYARDFVNHGLHRDAGLDEDQAAVHWEKQACPDLKMTVDLMVAEGDLVTVVWRARGANTAAASPLPATGVNFELRGITVWRIDDGKIREEWTDFDMLGVVRQAVIQLKGKLLGLLCVIAILFWTASRAVRSLRVRGSMR